MCMRHGIKLQSRMLLRKLLGVAENDYKEVKTRIMGNVI